MPPTINSSKKYRSIVRRLIPLTVTLADGIKKAGRMTLPYNPSSKRAYPKIGLTLFTVSQAASFAMMSSVTTPSTSMML